MFRISLLQDQFREKARQQDEYWIDLHKNSQALAQGFASYLASDDTYEDRLENQPNVTAGVLLEDGSVETELSSVSKQGRQFYFHIVIYLEDVRREDPKNYLAFRLSMERGSGAKLVVRDLATAQEFSTQRGFVAVYEHLYAKCQQVISGT